ncbi:MAG: hypothetical protein V1838_02950 [Patescibacteria group bacterium]
MNRGFTTIELLAIIGVIAILTTIGVPSYRYMRQNVAVNTSAEEVVDVLRVAQNQSLTAQDGQSWGVHFAATAYTLYSGDWTAPLFTAEYNLDSGVNIISASLPEVEFSRLTGTSASGSIVVGLPSGKQKTISVTPAGTINLN